MKSLWRGVVPLAAGLFAVGVLGTGPVAQAGTADDWAYNGSDYGGVTHEHEQIYACDRERDGHAVYTEFYLEDSHSRWKIADENGTSKPSCGSTSSGYGEVTKFRVCERGKWCTRWHAH